MLRPLGPLLQEIHASVAGSADPPHEVTVEFGVQVTPPTTEGRGLPVAVARHRRRGPARPCAGR
nr:hypothetical protein [Streptomyces sp. F63]